jgi:hypothetical protein
MAEQSGKQSPAALAQRLRLLQAEMRDLPSAARAELLREQIEAAVKGLGATRAPAFLRELADHFPDGSSPTAVTAEPVAAVAAPVAAAQVAVAAPVAPAADPADGFLALTAEQRAAVVEELVANGLLSLPRSPQAGGVVGGNTEMSAMLCGFVSKVLPFFLRTLSSLGVAADGLVDQASVQRLEALAAGNCENLDAAELRAEIEQLGVCLCSLMSVVPTLGKFCTQALAQQLAAERIEDLARNEGKGTFERWEAIYWRKYREVSKAFSDGTLERDVNQKVAGHVDKWLQRTRQHTPARKGKSP